MARFNVGKDMSELRLVIGNDVGSPNDRFVLGTTTSPVIDKSGGFTAMFAVGMDGNVRARGAFTGNVSPDLAETIPTAADVTVADVVCADRRHRERAVRCSRGESALLGVIADGSSTFLIPDIGERDWFSSRRPL